MATGTGALLVLDAVLVDGIGADPRPGSWALVTDGRVRAVGSGPAEPAHAGVPVLDAQGRTLMPGLIDAHTHLGATAHPPWNIAPVEHVLDTAREIEETLADGFTTVRDAAGLPAAYARATGTGTLRGPRLLVSDASIGQTGGHGDTRAPDDLTGGQRSSTWRDSIVADGADEVRRAAREVLRRGAHHVKVMAGGGCISPADPIHATQLSLDEIRAAVEESAARGTYVMAHTYLPESIQRCLRAGVRSIEHGNLLDEKTAHLLAGSQAWLVPTLATYELLGTRGRDLGYDAAQVDKIDVVRASALDALRLAVEAGVRIGSGSDLLAGFQRSKALELELKASVMGPMAALVASTATNADLVGRNDLGRVVPGAVADLLLVDGSPVDDITVLQDRSRIHAVIQDGRISVDRLPEHPTGDPTRGVN